MQITDVRIKRVDNQSRLKAVVSITFDNAFVVHELRVIEGSNGLFVTMPSRETKSGVYKDIAHPITAVAREEIEKAVLEKFHEESETE